MKSPDEFNEWIQFSTSSSIMEIMYGLEITSGDPYVDNAKKALDGFNEVAVPGKFWVDMFPVMKYIPSWFPGAGWKRLAHYWRDINRDVRLKPYNFVKDQMEQGNRIPSICRTMIDDLPDSDSPDRTVKEDIAIDVCAVSFLGDLSAARVFFMAMVLYPEVQRKAQAKVDRVLDGRLPELADCSSLPYVNAMVKETLRWQPVSPMSIPHATTDADKYNGYYIPKGTIVIGNAWTLMHDPEVYKDPEDYIPDCFLKDGELDSSVRDPFGHFADAIAVFGYGRRVCPGRYFGLNALFLMIAHTLAVFDIKPALDENGKEIEFKADVTGGVISHPVPFQCRIVPRSKAAIDLIRNSDLME
ncbi:hypothetical protein AGABI1DRAFT_61296 [Agaricus bisporus var. burnettii JB137-S8]|uniref:Cytochrome P450 n=1 Tax=Agaricus bisporus var. burnettii (strain JB137-S8 / ATCC MYA-4627 / FGSC 10392) TaxID=597362 RepID=K5XS38_AGABU|nr:uncharacterized protein AGABI1DRAFT_61296 [Agaricus bisporus var. burnettii JB137-S8]EKM77725.1 hypothetical protein AGABI1DRAFT_61296 [Agaricus bisporus var. burnettii JB137-S8]